MRKIIQVVSEKFKINIGEATLVSLVALYFPYFLLSLILGIYFLSKRLIFRFFLILVLVVHILLLPWINSTYEIEAKPGFNLSNVLIASSGYARFNFELNRVDDYIVNQSRLLIDTCGKRKLSFEYSRCMDNFYNEMRVLLVNNAYNAETFFLIYSRDLFLTLGDVLNQHESSDYQMNEFKEIVSRYSSFFIHNCNLKNGVSIFYGPLNLDYISASFFERMLISFELRSQSAQLSNIVNMRFLRFLANYRDKIDYNAYSTYFLNSLSKLSCLN